jgi:DNA-directed RNA polymerase specialized sigma24 family protein
MMQVAELRAVMGLEVTEIAQALRVSEPTVKRDWQRAKAYLFDALGMAS